MTRPVPQGYKLAGVYCGIKRNSERPDFTMIVSESDASAAGGYTKNLVFAAPVENQFHTDLRVVKAEREFLADSQSTGS